MDKIKRPPDFVIIDESHLATKRYVQIKEHLLDLNPSMKLLGVTATPERLDGMGLNKLFDTLVMGPSIKELVELGYLSNVQYFCPPVQGLADLHRRGTEFVQEDVERLLLERKIYGKAIEHYQRHARGRSTLVFCRSLKSAEQTAQKFTDAGYHFENIDGTMTHKKRKGLIQALRDGRIKGLTSCELITYGLDVPSVDCIIMLRPTLSRALYSQMTGRGLRVNPGKENCVVLDHVGNLQVHGHPLEDYDWNFDGYERKKKKRETDLQTLRLCPALDYMYCSKPSCVGCEHSEDGKDPRQELETVDAELVEAKPIPLGQRPPEERKEFNDRVSNAVYEFNQSERVQSGPVAELLKVAEELGRNPLWAYHRLTEGRKSVHVPLLHEIAKIKGYKPGWAYFQRKELSKR
jgi:superfamily II DNA or RNA helicase